MNWKLFAYRHLNSSMHGALASPRFPLTRYFPRGISRDYDVSRFAGTRDLPVVFDVGANTGQTLSGFVRYYPKSRIYSFEPVSATFEELKRNYARYPNVRFVQKALGSEPGEVVIQLHTFSELNTLTADAASRRGDLTGQTETIQIDTVDRFCEAEGIEAIDLLKMDVQGWELEVLKGSSRLLAASRVRFIYAEVGFSRAEQDMQFIGDVCDFCEGQGFKFCGFYHTFRYGDRKEFTGFSNALFINPDFSC